MDFGVVVPCYRESSRPAFRERLVLLSQMVKEQFRGRDVKVMLVFDGEDKVGFDMYREFIRINKPYGEWRWIHRAANKGKGFSIMEGIKYLPADYVLFTDADFPVDFGVVGQWLNILDTGVEIDGFFAQREFFEYGRSLVRRLGGSLAQWSERVHFGIVCSDTQCGFKMVRRDAFLKYCSGITCTRWLFDVELVKLMEQSKRIYYAYVNYSSHDDNSSLRPVLHLPSILAEWGFLLWKYSIRPHIAKAGV